MCLTEISVIVVDSQTDREEVSHLSKRWATISMIID